MHKHDLERYQHEHTFAQDQRRPGESRTLLVIAITAIMMVIELIAGVVFGSMALLADGLHMASHTAALGITAFAYAYARRNARNRSYSFGTGKVNALGGFTGAVLLAIFALFMAFESIARLLNPVEIVFNQAIFVAILGLIVNGVSVIILDAKGHGHEHHHHAADAHDKDHGHAHDHNLRSAYLHVIADALTSVLAILALLAAKYFGLIWMDPVVGIVGALLVARWSYGLMRASGAVLLDRQAPRRVLEQVQNALEDDGDTRVTDLHVWSIGPAIYAAEIAVVTHAPLAPAQYKARLPRTLGLVHVAVEVQTCVGDEAAV